MVETTQQILEKYESPSGFHRHKCPHCDNIWEHSDSCAGNKEEHTCICGEKNWERYRGPEPPTPVFILALVPVDQTRWERFKYRIKMLFS